MKTASAFAVASSRQWVRQRDAKLEKGIQFAETLSIE